MGADEKRLIKDIKSGKLKSVYLLTGEENYAIDMLSDCFENNVVAEELRDFDQTIFYGRDVTMDIIVNTARRFPMMSPYQLVLVKEAQDIRNWDYLFPYLENPQPQTVLVFCYRHKKMEKSNKVYKAISKHGEVFEKAKLRDYQVPEWISGYVQENGYKISPQASVILAESIGLDLSKIANEVSKIFITLPKGSEITPNVIEQNIGISKDYNVFELQNAIGQKDIKKCNQIVNYFAANPADNPIQMVISVLYGYFIKVMIYHQEPDKKNAASALGVNPYFLSQYQRAAANYSLPKLATIIGYLKDADQRSKGIGNSGSVTDGELLKELMFKILH